MDTLPKADTTNYQWTTDFLREQFQKESDRAAVILSASLIDETLTTLIRSFLVPCSNAQDVLFESPNSPLANFSSKIDMAYRLGLISAKLVRDIHLIRKIRNSFAHDIFGCNFENGTIKSRVMELQKSIVIVKHFRTSQKLADHLKGTRGEFLHCVFFILWHLNELNQNTTQISGIEEERFLYTVSNT